MIPMIILLVIGLLWRGIDPQMIFIFVGLYWIVYKLERLEGDVSSLESRVDEFEGDGE